MIDLERRLQARFHDRRRERLQSRLPATEQRLERDRIERVIF